MSDDRPTPVDNTSAIQMFAHDMHATRLAAQTACTSQLQMYEEFKAFRKEVDGWRNRTWAPAVVATIAAIVSVACAAAAAVGH